MSYPRRPCLVSRRSSMHPSVCPSVPPSVRWPRVRPSVGLRAQPCFRLSVNPSSSSLCNPGPSTMRCVAHPMVIDPSVVHPSPACSFVYPFTRLACISLPSVRVSTFLHVLYIGYVTAASGAGGPGAAHLPQRPNLFFRHLASLPGMPRTSLCKELSVSPSSGTP